MRHIAIIGASLAGLSAAESLREHGFDGAITVVDRNPTLPADRPPLSKQVLAGTMEPATAHQPLAGQLDSFDLDLRLGVGAAALRPAEREVDLEDGTTLSVDGVVVATGAEPRRLPTDLAGVYVLRDLDDSLAIKADLDAGASRVAVIGAGFIGAEVAATCRARGVDVTMIEAQSRPMQRVLPGPIGDFVTELHLDHGVDVRLGVGVDELMGAGRVAGVRLDDGSVVDADVVVVGIGVVPNTAWLDGSGLDVANGIGCDATCLAAPGVVAAGDLARWPNPRYGETMRVEQWENAMEQGAYVARRLLEGDGPVEPFTPIPWFWSDQYDRKIQVAGRVDPDDEVRIVHGSIEERRFVAVFRRGDRCVAVLGVNRPAQVMRTRMAMASEGGLSWDDAVATLA
jgi:3-phenylpropionate/trans-cinnamate dioxygenase ferredoxin reductase component